MKGFRWQYLLRQSGVSRLLIKVVTRDFSSRPFRIRRARAFYAFTPLENKKSKEESNDGTERI